MFIYIYFSISSETTCSDIHIYVYISSMQTSYLTSAFHPIRSLSSLQLIWKIWHLLNYFIILSFLSCSPCLRRRPGFLLLDPNHSFYVHLGRAKDHPKWMTLKTSVKTWSQLRMASPAILWTQREGTLTMSSWQRMSGSPPSEGSSFASPGNSTLVSVPLLSFINYQGQIIYFISPFFFPKKFCMCMKVKGCRLYPWRPLES